MGESWISLFGSCTGTYYEVLLETQAVLGPLPPEIMAKIPKRFKIGKRLKNREDAIYFRIRDPVICTEQRDDSEKFSDHELRLFVDLIKKMMAWRPEDRLTAEEALKHDFFR